MLALGVGKHALPGGARRGRADPDNRLDCLLSNVLVYVAFNGLRQTAACSGAGRMRERGSLAAGLARDRGATDLRAPRRFSPPPRRTRAQRASHCQAADARPASLLRTAGGTKGGLEIEPAYAAGAPPTLSPPGLGPRQPDHQAEQVLQRTHLGPAPVERHLRTPGGGAFFCAGARCMDRLLAGAAPAP
jgi:hypothetical protein